LCNKGFCGEEFVIKHINNKHADDIKKDVVQRYFKNLAREAYIADKAKIEGAPIPHSFSTYAVGAKKQHRQQPTPANGAEPGQP